MCLRSQKRIRPESPTENSRSFDLRASSMGESTPGNGPKQLRCPANPFEEEVIFLAFLFQFVPDTDISSELDALPSPLKVG